MLYCYKHELFVSYEIQITTNGNMIWTCFPFLFLVSLLFRGRRDRMVDGFTTIYAYNYLCNQCLSPHRVRIPLMARCTRYKIMC